MAQPINYPNFISTLTQSLTSALESLPDSNTVSPPQEGLSLLDTKNELLLSYLQNIVFLVILKLRNSASQSPLHDFNHQDPIHDAVIQNLITLRVYIQTGVRPLESRLKYQIDKLVVASAEDSSYRATKEAVAKRLPRIYDETDPPNDSNSENSSNEDIHVDRISTSQAVPDLSHRPNPSSLARPHDNKTSTSNFKSELYRPPHITPTALPSKKKPHTREPNSLKTFLAEEMTDAPLAEPSIGAGSGLRGRAVERELERRNYEEGRLVRLPGEKKKRRRGTVGEDLSDLIGLGEGNTWDNFGKAGKKRRGGGRQENN